MVRWFVLLALSIPDLAVATDLAGTWEVQSMGGDRKVEIQQRGNTVIAHRVMWPTFEGQKYKLEHLYRGKVSGKQIRGELLVKEEELPDYEILRAFDGTLSSNDTITIDGLPMKRMGGSSAGPAASAPTPAPPPSESPKRLPPPDAPPPPPDAPPPPPDAPPPEEAEATDAAPGAGLFSRIISSPGMENLFDEALKIAIPEAVAQLTAEGDELFTQGKLQPALAKFEEASTTGGGADPQLLHRKGSCLLKLKRWTEAKRTLRAALKLDPSNKAIKRDYKKAKRRSR